MRCPAAADAGAETELEFMRMLQELRDQMHGPLRVCIGRRSYHHNDRVSTAKNKKNGVHILGLMIIQAMLIFDHLAMYL